MTGHFQYWAGFCKKGPVHHGATTTSGLEGEYTNKLKMEKTQTNQARTGTHAFTSKASRSQNYSGNLRTPQHRGNTGLHTQIIRLESELGLQKQQQKGVYQKHVATGSESYSTR